MDWFSYPKGSPIRLVFAPLDVASGGPVKFLQFHYSYSSLSDVSSVPPGQAKGIYRNHTPALLTRRSLQGIPELMLHRDVSSCLVIMDQLGN